MSPLAGFQRRGIVTAHFPTACAARRHTVVLAHNAYIARLKPGFEVRADRRYKHDEFIFLAGLYSHLCRCAKLDWTDIKRRSGAIGWNESFVELDNFFHHLNEFFLLGAEPS